MDNQNGGDTQGKSNPAGPQSVDVSGGNPKNLNSTDPKNSSSGDEASSTPVFGDLERKQSPSTDLLSKDLLAGTGTGTGSSNRPLECDEQDTKEAESIEKGEQKRVQMQSEDGQEGVECEEDEIDDLERSLSPIKLRTEVDRARTEEEANFFREYLRRGQLSYEKARAKADLEAKERELAKSPAQRAEEAEKAAKYARDKKAAIIAGRKNRRYDIDFIKRFMKRPVRGEAERNYLRSKLVDGPSSNSSAAPSSGLEVQEKPKTGEH